MCTSHLFWRLVEQEGSDQELGTILNEWWFQWVIIKAYQVSQKTHSGLGMETTYMQQWRKLEPMFDDNCNPYHHFWSNWCQQIQGFQAQGNKHFLLMDANSEYKEEILYIYWINVFSGSSWGLTPNPTTSNVVYKGEPKNRLHPENQKISATATKGRMNTNEDGLKFSDHRALFIDLKESVFLRTKAPIRLPQKTVVWGLKIKNKPGHIRK